MPPQLSPDDTFPISDLTSYTEALSLEHLLHGRELSDAGKRVAEVCKMVAEHQRFCILCLVHQHDMNCSSLMPLLNELQPAISHHIALLRGAGFFAPDRQGKQVYYSYLDSGRAALRSAGDYLSEMRRCESDDEQSEPSSEQTDILSVDSLIPEGVPNDDGKAVMATLKLLGDDVRFNMLLRLSGMRLNVKALCEELSMSQPAVSHHLGIFIKGNMLERQRDGKHQFYSIPEHGIQNIRRAARTLKALGTKTETKR